MTEQRRSYEMPRKKPTTDARGPAAATPPAPQNDDDADLPVEVLAFIDAEEDYQAYKAANEGVIRNLIAFANARNAAFEAADKVVRSRAIEVGPFRFKTRPYTKVNTERAVAELGQEKFLALGGTVRTETVYELDARAVEIAIATNRLAPEVAKKFTEEQVRYCSIPMVSIP